MRLSIFKGGNEVPVLLVMLGAAMFVATIAHFALTRRPSPPPNSTIYGCWASPLGPPIAFGPDGMRTASIGRAAISYHLTWRGTMRMRVRLDRPYSIRYGPGRSFAYAPAEDEMGRELMPAHVVEGRTYDVLKAEQIEFLETWSVDGTTIDFRRAPPGECASFL